MALVSFKTAGLLMLASFALAFTTLWLPDPLDYLVIAVNAVIGPVAGCIAGAAAADRWLS